MLTDTGVEPDPTPDSETAVREAVTMVETFEFPTESWPSIVQQLHEIDQATQEAHGGPLVTPTLPEVQVATWSEIRAALAAEKAKALPPAPAAPTRPAATASGPLMLPPGRAAASVIIDAELVDEK